MWTQVDLNLNIHLEWEGEKHELRSIMTTKTGRVFRTRGKWQETCILWTCWNPVEQIDSVQAQFTLEGWMIAHRKRIEDVLGPQEVESHVIEMW